MVIDAEMVRLAKAWLAGDCPNAELVGLCTRIAGSAVTYPAGDHPTALRFMLDHAAEVSRSIGYTITPFGPAELRFVGAMQQAADDRVGFGFMQQITEVEWQHRSNGGGWGPATYTRWMDEKDRMIERKTKEVIRLRGHLDRLHSAGSVSLPEFIKHNAPKWIGEKFTQALTQTGSVVRTVFQLGRTYERTHGARFQSRLRKR